MIYRHNEGDLCVGNGIHYYPLGDPSSAGFILVLANWKLRVRYSKLRKRFFVITALR